MVRWIKAGVRALDLIAAINSKEKKNYAHVADNGGDDDVDHDDDDEGGSRVEERK